MYLVYVPVLTVLSTISLTFGTEIGHIKWIVTSTPEVYLKHVLPTTEVKGKPL